MRTSKLAAGLLAAAILSATALGGCTQANSSSGTSGTGTSAPSETQGSSTTPESSGELANKDVKMLVSVTGGKDDAEMKLFQEELSKKTGLNVTMEKPADYSTALVQKLQAGEKYDLIYMNTHSVPGFVEQGALKDITSEVQSSPILWDPDNIDPQEWKDVTIDGKIYTGFNKREVHMVVNLNNAHLKAIGVDYKQIPPTLDGYYDVFKKLKESGPSVEGYYPFNACIPSLFDIQPWMAAEGLKGGIVTVDGKNTVPFASDASVPVWEWFAKLYKEGLMDPNSIADPTTALRSKIAAGQTSIAVDRATQVGLRNNEALTAGLSQDEFQIVSLPGIQTPDGSYMLTKGEASLFGVPANAPNVPGAIKVLEFFATQEGGVLLSAGVEGNDYTVDASGKYTLTDVGQKHGLDHGAQFPISLKFKSPFPRNPGVEEALTYIKYASIEEVSPLNDMYSDIMGKWAVQIVKGDVTVQDGLASLQDELKANGVIS